MKLFICIDKSGGILFNNRRQSMDSVVRKRMLEIIGERKLFLNQYSESQFEDKSKLTVSDNFISLMADDDFCFIENTDFDVSSFNELYVFNWNRNYPFDKSFLIDNSFKKIKTECFAGTSHDKITLTIYRSEAK